LRIFSNLGRHKCPVSGAILSLLEVGSDGEL